MGCFKLTNMGLTHSSQELCPQQARTTAPVIGALQRRHNNSSGIGSSEEEEEEEEEEDGLSGKEGGFSFFPLASASLERGWGRKKKEVKEG